jgi:hypothetical protein
MLICEVGFQNCVEYGVIGVCTSRYVVHLLFP